MVARQPRGGEAHATPAHVAAGAFAWWRLWLSSVVSRLRTLPRVRPSRTFARALAPLARALRSPATASGLEERRALAAAGVLALAAGCTLSLALARPLGVAPAEAAIGAAWTLAWAAARLGILRLTCPRLPASAVGLAWAGGLLPAALALSDPLRVLALAASAWLTVWTLRAAGARGGEARSAVLWAFGAEAAAMAARWIGSGVLLYLVVR